MSLFQCCIIYCVSIQALLSAPNPDDPLSENIAKHWKTNEAEAVETGNMNNHFSYSISLYQDVAMWPRKVPYWILFHLSYTHIDCFYVRIKNVLFHPKIIDLMWWNDFSWVYKALLSCVSLLITGPCFFESCSKGMDPSVCKWSLMSFLVNISISTMSFKLDGWFVIWYLKYERKNGLWLDLWKMNLLENIN